MKDIEKIIEEIDADRMDSVMGGKLVYDDIMPAGSEEIEEQSKRNKMKYYEGSVTKEEHEELRDGLIKEGFFPAIVYDEYLFSDTDILEKDVSALTAPQIDEIIDLWLLKPDGCEYIENFEKLMFLLYRQNGDPRIKKIAVEIHEKYDWAKRLETAGQRKAGEEEIEKGIMQSA